MRPYATHYLRSLFFLCLLVVGGISESSAVIVTVGTGTDTTSFSPANRRYAYSAFEAIYTASEIGTSGTIDTIWFQKSSGSTSVNVNYIDIYIKETSATGASSSSSTASYSGGKLYAGYIDNTMSSGWTRIILSTPFNYTGTQNLSILIVKGNETATTSWPNYPVYNCTVTSTNMAAYYFGSSGWSSSFTATTTRRPNIRFSIQNTCAGKPTSGSITGPTAPVCPSVNFTLNGSGATIATGISYQWQSRPVSGTFTNISGATLNTLTTSITASTEYRLITNCSYSAKSDTSAGFTVNPLSAPVIIATGDTTFCSGGSVTLTTTAVSGVSYQWQRGASPISGATTNSYVATTSGVYTLVAYTPSCSGVTSNTKTVTVNPLPTATATALTSTTFCSGDSVILQANTGSGLSYEWQESSSPIAGATGSQLIVKNSGTYRVKVTNTTTGCTNLSSTVSVTVNPSPAKPVIAGDGGATSFCTGSSLTMSTTSVSGVTYQWYNTGGPISGATTNSYTTTIPQTYRLVATQGSCSATSNSIVVTENALPSAGTLPTGTASFCNGDSLKVLASVASGVTYEWQESSTAISGATANTYWVKTAGVYRVKVTNTSTGCSNTSPTLTVTVISPAVPTVSASGPTSFCEGGSVTLNGSIGAGLAPQWQESGVDISAATTTSYTTSSTGDYRLKVTDGVGCSAYSSVIKVKANPLPKTDLTFGATDICFGDSTSIAAPVQPGHKYQWMKGGVDILGATKNPFYASTAGNYAVRIIDSNSCTDTSRPDVTITVKYVAPFSIAPRGNTYFCDGDSVKLSTQEGFTSYQWSFNSTDIPGATDTMIYAKKSGKYYVTVQDPVNGCKAKSKGFNISVIPSPATPAITRTGNLLSTTVTGVTYQWYRNGVPITGADDSTYTVTTNGLYVVEVTNLYGCTSKAGIYVFSVGIDDVDNNGLSYKVYPNPTHDKLFVEAPQGAVITLRDIQGRVVATGKDLSEVDMSSLSQGMYLLMITGKDDRVLAVEKITKY